ncbi:solute carrier family 22 member 7-like [Triplophysa rosa]|uniref:Solute carrier family 22 member 6 n=1 Tax=Triplophysa rosa TaxID=992332 RepID=A0A9W7WMY1_TRIRA|nr:solute carrier family 22 member 7-like [Triplophysa rosa]KAI7805115.1 putative solute carrier family 22 member 7 [Triplophysa rosa]
MKFEDLLTELNGFGRFQTMIICINFIGRFITPCHFLLSNFIAAIPSHHCDISSLDVDGIFGNLSREERLTVSIPKQEDGTLASCHMFSHPQYQLLSNSSSSTDLPVVRCQNGWVYDNSTFSSTLATQWDLVCDNRGLNKAVATIFFVGVMFGAVFFGGMSDRFGRKPMLLVSYVSAMGFAVASAFSSSFIMFAVLRFFTGFTITGIIIITSVLNVEWVDIQHRRLVCVVDSVAWASGTTALSLFGFCVRDWRWLTVAVTSPLLLCTILWWWVPESARWLMVNGKTQKAHYYLHRCAVMNHREEVISSIEFEALSSIITTNTEKRKHSYLDIIRTPKMRRLALLTGTIWFCVATTTYGIGFNISGFGLNLYMTQFVYGAIEIPAKLSLFYLLEKIGRRRTETGALLLAAISLMINIFIPRDQQVGRTVVAVLGKGFSVVAFATIILYSSELYPTVLRQNGLGYNSFLGRLGVALAPLVLLLDSFLSYLPQITLCCVALSGSLVAWQLPETRGRCLPETIEDIEGTEEKLKNHDNHEETQTITTNEK